MNYRHPDLRRALAAEYVLGTLSLLARRRFERLTAHDALLRAEVTAWQDTLYDVLDFVPGRPPPASVWARISTELGFDPAPHTAAVASVAALPAHAVPWWRSLGLWQGATALAMAASLVMAVALFTRGVPVTVVAPSYTAVLGDGDNRAAWLVRATTSAAAPSTLTVVSLSAHALDPGKAFELWVLPGPGQGDAPRSLGLIPAAGQRTLMLSAALFEDLPAAAGLAVSLEPGGGSPTGQPTGPVLFQSIATYAL